MTTTQRFSTAKEYMSYMVKAWGAKYTRDLDRHDLQDRLEAVRDISERYSRSSIYGENALPFGYNPASYGLWWVVTSSRINGETALALRQMSIRQLSELVHILLVECGPTTGHYAGFLMKRFSRTS
jgi:hypothetical protein